MSTRQPEWKFVANLGDVNAIDNGGLFLYEDATGQYPPELEKLERVSDADNSVFEIYRVMLDRYKEVRGEISERAYLVPLAYDPTWPHPLPQYEEWFTRSLAGVAATMSTTETELRAALCSDDSKARAWAYQCIYDHHGWANGDSYPLTLTLDEVEDRYTRDEVSKRDPIDRLRDAIEAEHVADCGDNNTCDINKAFEEELYLWAARLLTTSATECPRTISALAALAPTEQQLNDECRELLEHPHMRCPECNATVWTEECKDTCGNCCKTVQRRIKIENSDDQDIDDEGRTIEWVLVTARGSDAARWAKEDQQSLCGSRWEADGDDFAYNKLVDGPKLLEEIRAEVGEDVEIDDSEYCPPDEE